MIQTLRRNPRRKIKKINLLERKKNLDSKIYTSIVQDTNDGSGDAFVELPPEIIESMNLKEDDLFNIDTKNGTIILTKIEK